MTCLVVVGSGRDIYREYILDALGSGYELCLVDDRPLGWRGRYVHSYLNSALTLADVLDALRGPNGPSQIAGVLTWEEQSVVLAAQLAEKLGVPARLPVEAAKKARDKHLMRQAWAATGVPSARSLLVHSAREARAAFRTLGPTVVVKPRGLAASAGVRQVCSEEDITTAYDTAAAARLDRYELEDEASFSVLVEEYLDGPEYSVEAAVTDDRFVPLAVAAKTTGPLPQFEEVEHVVGAPSERHEPMLDIVRRAVACLGLRNTMVHAEVRDTAAGPKMIEVGARLGGDLIPYVAELATGRSLARVGAKVALGHLDDDQCLGEARFAGIRFLYAERGGTMRGVAAPEDLTRRPWLHRVIRTVDRGATVPDPLLGGVAARVGYVIVTGWSSTAVRERLAEVAAATQITIERDG